MLETQKRASISKLPLINITNVLLTQGSSVYSGMTTSLPIDQRVPQPFVRLGIAILGCRKIGDSRTLSKVSEGKKNRGSQELVEGVLQWYSEDKKAASQPFLAI